jgi:hypothetical protein
MKIIKTKGGKIMESQRKKGTPKGKDEDFNKICEAFGRNYSSLSQSILARWPDIGPRDRGKEVLLWYEQLSKQMKMYFRKYGIRNNPETRGLFVMATFANAIILFTQPMQEGLRDKLIAQRDRFYARVEQIGNTLIKKSKQKIKLEITAAEAFAQCDHDILVWGQHGANS